jgi:hypothetical protein
MGASELTTLYLRGVPRRVVRGAKAAAARAGQTLGRWVSERLEQAADPAPAKRPDTDAVRAAMAWYEANRRRLERKYPGEYVAIVGRRVVDHGEQFDDLARRVFERFGVRSICMPKVGRSEVRLRSPRRAGR